MTLQEKLINAGYENFGNWYIKESIEVNTKIMIVKSTNKKFSLRWSITEESFENIEQVRKIINEL